MVTKYWPILQICYAAIKNGEINIHECDLDFLLLLGCLVSYILISSKIFEYASWANLSWKLVQYVSSISC